MAGTPDAKNVQNAAATVGSMASAELAPMAGAVALLGQLQSALTSIMSNPALGGAALQTIGYNIQNHFTKRMKESLGVTIEQGRELDKLNVGLMKTARYATIAAGTVGSFALKMAQANTETRKLGIEMSGMARLSQMPGGGDMFSTGKWFAEQKIATTFGVNANIAELQQKAMALGWGGPAGRDLDKNQKSNLALLSSYYEGSNRGNLIGNMNILQGAFAGQLNPLQSSAFVQSMVNVNEKKPLGSGTPAENLANMMRMLTAMPEAGQNEFGKAAQMTANAAIETTLRIKDLPLDEQAAMITSATTSFSDPRRIGAITSWLRENKVPLPRGVTPENFYKGFTPENGTTQMMNFIQQATESFVGGKRNAKGELVGGATTVGEMGYEKGLKFETLAEAMKLSSSTLLKMARGGKFDLGIDHATFAFDKLEEQGKKLSQGAGRTPFDNTLESNQKKASDYRDTMKGIKDWLNQWMSNRSKESTLGNYTLSAIGLAAENSTLIGNVGVGLYASHKFKQLAAAGKLPSAGVEAAAKSSKLVTDLTAEEVLANKASFVKPGEAAGIEKIAGSGSKLSKLGKFGKAAKLGGKALAALSMAYDIEEGARLGPEKVMKNTEESLQSFLHPKGTLDFLGGIGGIISTPFQVAGANQTNRTGMAVALGEALGIYNKKESDKFRLMINQPSQEQKSAMLKAGGYEEISGGIGGAAAGFINDPNAASNDTSKNESAGVVNVYFRSPNGDELAHVVAKQGQQNTIYLGLNSSTGVSNLAG